MPELIKLEAALEGILDGIMDQLEAENGEEGELSDVNTFIRGDKTRPTPVPPTIWVRGLTATPDHTQRSYAEKWMADFIILAIVKKEDPEQGYKDANALAARARSIVLGDRTLGNRNYVQDVRSGQFEMSGPHMQNDTLSAATAIIKVSFVILERNP